MSNLKRVDPTPLAPRPASEPWRSADWQKLWLSVRQKNWSSLALVPGAVGAPADFALTIAVTLARIGMMHLGTPIQVADATTIPLVHLVQFTDELSRIKADGELALVALAPASENPITVSLAQAADACVLCVLLEAMSVADTRDTVVSIGSNRFIGQAVFRSPPEPAQGDMKDVKRPGR